MKRCFLVLSFFLGLAGYSSDLKYAAPDPEKFPIDHSKVIIPAEKQEQLATELAKYLMSLPAGRLYETAPKPLAIALFLDSDNREALVLHVQLKKGVVPKKMMGTKTKAQMCDKLTRYSTKLAASKSEPNIKLAGYLLDVALVLDPAHADATFELEMHTQKHGKPKWDDVLPGGGKQKEAMPKGPNGRITIKPGMLNKYKDHAREFVKSQATVKALMVLVSDQGYFGKPMDLIASVALDANTSEFGARFAQVEIGEQMRVSMKEAYDVARTRYPFWKGGTRVLFSFGNKYTPKDGGSAGAAFALLFLSLLDGIEIDPQSGITGDLTLDWKIRKVGAVPYKALGALDGGLTRVAFPDSNADEFYDYIMVESPSILWDLQLFTIKDLPETIETMRKDRTEDRKKGEAIFAEVQKRLKRMKHYGLNVETDEKLQEVLKLCPNHFSAKVLREIRARKLAGRKLSANFSMSYIIGTCYPILDAVKLERGSAAKNVDDESLKKMQKKLAKLRGKLPGEVNDLHRRFYKFTEDLRDYKNYEKRDMTNFPVYKTVKRSIAENAKKIKSELKRLFEDEDFHRKLMRE